jgi:Tol biopolymer transport system component
MKTIAILVVLLIALSATAVPLQLVSERNGAVAPSASGGGDSLMPILGGNGRYVLFASSANNLALTAGNTPFQKPGITLDVFLRDRASNTTVLVSANLAGTGGGDQDALPVGVSSNGQFVLFESASDNLVSGDTNSASDVFVRDVVNGITILVSANTNGVCGNGASYSSAMTPDGRYVAFASAATDLVPGDANGIPDIFVRDLLSGTTRLASVGAKATNSLNQSLSDTPAITPDGHYVTFYSSATNLVPGQIYGGEIFQRDMVAGTTAWISVGARALFKSVTGSSNAVPCNLRMSDDGTYIAFEVCTNSPTAVARGIILRYSRATGLTDLVHTNAYFPWGPFENIQDLDMTPDGRFVAYVANITGNTGTNTAIYLWDAQAGTNILVSANTNNVLPAGNFCDQPMISSNGQYVAFFSGSAELATNASGSGPFAYLRDVSGGATILINSDTNAASVGDGSMLSLGVSADGQCVVFESSIGSLVMNDDNRDYDVFLRNVTNGFAELISARQPILPSLTGVGSCSLSSQPISQDGHYVTFASSADGLAPGNPSPAGSDVYVCDLFAGTNQFVSVATLGNPASGISYEPVISGDGRYVAFTSAATNLIAVDTNKSTDVFIRDLQTQTTMLVSANSVGTGEGNKDSYSPTISSDGRFLLFVSKASNLTAGSFSGTDNLFLRDRQYGTNYALITAGQGCAAMTRDGHFVAFAGASGSVVYVWDSQQTKQITNRSMSGTIQALAISPDGNRIATMAGSSSVSISIWDRASNTVYSVGSGYIIYSHPGLRFSADGRFLTYAMHSTTAGTNQVYLYDFQTQSNLLVSRAANLVDSGNATSDGPDISADGRFIIYRSAASNLVVGDTNGLPEDFLFDTTTGTNTILSSGAYGYISANNRSLPPMFSGDGHTVAFSSWGNDLIAGDFNQFNDVFAFAFLYAAVTVTNDTPTINWPASADRTYSVQSKDDLLDPVWHNLAGAVTIVGNRGYLTDSTLASGHRFYRVLSNY